MPLRVPDAIMTEEESSMAGGSHFSAVSALSGGSHTTTPSAYYAGAIPPSPSHYNSTPFFSSNASVTSMDSADISLKRDREREGRCSECGMQTHDIQVDPRTQRTTKVPLTVENEVHRGRCLLCHPIRSPDSASVNSVSTHGTPRSHHHQQQPLAVVPDHVDSSSCNNSTRSHGSNSPHQDIQQALHLFQSESADLCDVLAAMRRFPNEAVIQARGCEKLWIQSYDEETSAAIGRVGGIGTILEAMSRFLPNGHVQQSGCEALQNLALSDEYNRDVICENGGILTIVRAMQRHETNSKIQQSGCTALANLAANHDVHTEIANTGGVHAIIKAAQGHCEDENVMRAAYQALRALGYNPSTQGPLPTLPPQQPQEASSSSSSRHSRRSRRSHHRRQQQQEGGDVVQLDQHGFPISGGNSNTIIPTMSSSPEPPSDQQEDVLYGDLEGATVASSSSATRPVKKQRRGRGETFPNVSALSQREEVDVQSQKDEIERLKNENETLKRNMGILFRTAKLEVQRKNAKIRALQEQIDKDASAK